MEIREFINSGILETYVLGVATEEEAEQVLLYKNKYQEISEALNHIELDIENFAVKNGVDPPVGTLLKIEEQIREIQLREQQVAKPREFENEKRQTYENPNPYIEVESTSSHMRIHKAWRWVFAAVFVLGKIFLATAIYFYFENRQAQQQLKELRTEIRTLNGR